MIGPMRRFADARGKEHAFGMLRMKYKIITEAAESLAQMRPVVAAVVAAEQTFVAAGAVNLSSIIRMNPHSVNVEIKIAKIAPALAAIAATHNAADLHRANDNIVIEAARGH